MLLNYYEVMFMPTRDSKPTSGGGIIQGVLSGRYICLCHCTLM